MQAMRVPRSSGKMDWKERKDWKVTRDYQGPQGSEARLVKWVPRSLGRQGSRVMRARRDSEGSRARQEMRVPRTRVTQGSRDWWGWLVRKVKWEPRSSVRQD
jgi:hypothetical protein